MAPPAGYGYYFDVDVATTADVSNAVFTLDLSNAPAGFWANMDTADGSDIYVTDDADNHLNRWLDGDFNIVGNAGTLHVLHDAAATGTTIRIYYGNASGSESNAATTWTTAGYVARWSFEESANPFVDSCGSWNATGTNLASYGDAGKLGLCPTYNGSSSIVSGGNITNCNGVAALSIEQWVLETDYAGSHMFNVKYDGSANGFGTWSQTGTTNLRTFVLTSGAAWNTLTTDYQSYVTMGQWWYLAVVFDGSQAAADRMKQYINATRRDNSVSGTSVTTLPSTSSNFQNSYAAYYHKGKIDEARIASAAHSAAFLAIAYNTQNDTAGYLTWGEQQTNGEESEPGTPSVSSIQLIDTGDVVHLVAFGNGYESLYYSRRPAIWG